MENVKLTRHGICYDLEKTPYRVEMDYNIAKVVFCFSSELYKDKFLDYLTDNKNKKIRIERNFNKYGILFDITLIEDIKEYDKIEKRGFFITLDKKKYTKLEDIKVEILFSV